MDCHSRLVTWSRLLESIILLAIVFLLSYVSAGAENKIFINSNGLAVEDTPEWIEKEDLELDALVQSVDPVNGIRVFLLSTQSNYTTPVPETYCRTVIQITNTSILAEQSTVDLEYTPKYQSYSVTDLNIIRGDETIDVREKVLIRFNQLEAPLGGDQFESLKKVMIFVPGLRVGDIIDFSFLIKGIQEAYQGTILGYFNHGAYFPAGRLSARILIPKNQKLNFFGINSPATSTKHEAGTYDEYRWVENAVKSSSFEINAPFWHPSFPVSHYSSFDSWSEVRKWAEPFFVSHEDPDQEISSLAKELTQGLDDEKEKLRAILTFMQREIRYVGMELGRNDLRPFPATTVLERRFGDCKDQTNLLLEILKSLKIKAFPVMTNSRQGRWMLTTFPTPVLFNHIFVCAEVDKHEYWIDPTMPIFGDQKAKLDHVSYGYGLRLDGVSTELVAIPEDPHCPTGAEYYIFVYPGAPELMNRAKVVIRQHITNDLATSFRLKRDQMGEEKHDEIKKDFAAKLFDGDNIEQLWGTEIIDTHLNNELDYKAEYFVKNPWKLDDKEINYEFWTYSQFVRHYLMRLENSENRVAPAMLNYPVNIEETFHILLPDLGFEELDETVESEYHYFNRLTWYSNGFLLIRYQYRTKEAFVPASDLDSFSKDIESIRGKLSYGVFLPKEIFDSEQIRQQFNIEPPKPELDIELPKPEFDTDLFKPDLVAPELISKEPE